MTMRLLPRTSWLAFIVAVLMAPLTETSGQIIPVDDFEGELPNDDGWIHLDFTDLEDLPWGPGIYSIVDGAYVLETSGPVPINETGVVAARWAAADDPTFSNGFLRLRINAGEAGTYAAVGMRLSGSLDDGFNGYWFGGDPGGGFLIDEIVDSNNRDLGRLSQDEYPFLNNEDWMIEAGAVADRLSLKVWRPDESEPEEPQLTVTHTKYTEGWFSLITNTSFWPRSTEAQIFTTFDDISFRLPVDCNADDAVNLKDTLCAVPQSIEHILVTANLTQGDADANGDVDFSDFLILSTNFNEDGNYQQGDFDLSGVVDFTDFLILSNNFGTTTAVVATSVPEPSGCGRWITVFGIFALVKGSARAKRRSQVSNER